MKIRVTKKFGNKLSIRDYQRDAAYNSGEDLIIVHDGKEHLIHHGDLKRKGKPSGVFINSRFNNQRYELIDFKVPKTLTIDKNQKKLFEL